MLEGHIDSVGGSLDMRSLRAMDSASSRCVVVLAVISADR